MLADLTIKDFFWRKRRVVLPFPVVEVYLP